MLSSRGAKTVAEGQTCLRPAHTHRLPSLAASIQLWRSRLGRVMCSMANCLLLMKVRPFLKGMSVEAAWGGWDPEEEVPLCECAALPKQRAQ